MQSRREYRLSRYRPPVLYDTISHPALPGTVSQGYSTLAQSQREVVDGQRSLAASVRSSRGSPMEVPAASASTRRHAPRALYEYALDDFEESGILKEHVTGTYDGNYGRIVIRKGKLYTCSSDRGSEWVKILAAAKTLPQEILDLGDMVWGHSKHDQAMTTRKEAKKFLFAKGSHPQMWDIACPDYDFVIQATFKKWSERLAELDVAADANPWSTKNDTAFFVGKFTGRDWPIDVSSATGGQPHTSDPVNNPRYAILCKDGTKTPKTGIAYETGLYAHGKLWGARRLWARL